MANRRFYQFTSSLVPELTVLQGKFSIGSTGAVSAIQGNGIADVVRLAAGQYAIKLQDQYYRFIEFSADLKAPVTGSAVNLTDGLSSGVVYEIVTVGTSTAANWQTAGLPVGFVPAVGQSFKAITAAAGTGTGTVKAIGVSGNANFEVVGDPQVMVNQLTNPQIIIQCLAATSSSVTTLVAADPASGSVMHFEIWLRNSSIKGLGE